MFGVSYIIICWWHIYSLSLNNLLYKYNRFYDNRSTETNYNQLNNMLVLVLKVYNLVVKIML